jgi:hypothetical protein
MDEPEFEAIEKVTVLKPITVYRERVNCVVEVEDGQWRKNFWHSYESLRDSTECLIRFYNMLETLQSLSSYYHRVVFMKAWEEFDLFQKHISNFIELLEGEKQKEVKLLSLRYMKIATHLSQSRRATSFSCPSVKTSPNITAWDTAISKMKAVENYWKDSHTPIRSWFKEFLTWKKLIPKERERKLIIDVDLNIQLHLRSLADLSKATQKLVSESIDTIHDIAIRV